MASNLETAFAYWWNLLAEDLPEPVTEYKFHPKRKWRMDVAWPDYRLCVELEGGVHNGGRHTRGAGFEADAEKYNAAAVMGWTVLRYTANMLNTDPERCIAEVRAVLERSA